MITNNYGLPAPIVNAINQNQYSGQNEERWASITDLLKPPYMWGLKRRLEREGVELETDVMNNFWAFIGTGVHLMIEKANEKDPNAQVEWRHKAVVDGRVISGGIDYFNPTTGDLIDYKTSSVYTIKKLSTEWDRIPSTDSTIKGYHLQLNLYAWLLRENGYDPQHLKLVVIARDWHMRQAQFKKHPATPIVMVESPMRSHDQMTAWIRNRIQAFDQAEEGLFEGCSLEDVWHKGDTYKIHTPKKKDSWRNLPSLAEAEAWVKANEKRLEDKGKPKISLHKGERTRCELYCDYAPHCGAYQKYLKDEQNERSEQTI